MTGVDVEVEHYEIADGLAVSRADARVLLTSLPSDTELRPQGAEAGRYELPVDGQIHLPAGSRPAPVLDRLNNLWWLTALLRLRASARIAMPVIAFAPWASDGVAARLLDPAEYMVAELQIHWERLAPHARPVLGEDDLRWIVDHWHAATGLLREKNGFLQAMKLFDGSHFAEEPEDALQALGKALRTVVKPTESLSSERYLTTLANFLEPSAEKRAQMSLQGRRGPDPGPLDQTDEAGLHRSVVAAYTLVRGVLLRILDNGCLPTQLSYDHGADLGVN